MFRFLALFVAALSVVCAQESAPAAPATAPSAPTTELSQPSAQAAAADISNTTENPIGTRRGAMRARRRAIAAPNMPLSANQFQQMAPVSAPMSAGLSTSSPTTSLTYTTPVMPDEASTLQPKPFGGSQELPVLSGSDPDEQVGPFFLVDETGPQVLSLLEQLTGKIILAQQTIPQVKINFNSRGTIARKDAITALETLLGLNGIAVLPLNGNFMRAIPTSGINNQAPQILMDADIQKLPPSQSVYTRVFKLESLTPSEALPLLSQLLTNQPQGAAAIIPFEKARAILVTDTLNNLQRMDRVIARLDRADDFESQVVFIPLKYAKASELVARLQRLQATVFRRSMANTMTWFEADDRTNQLMVISTPENVAALKQVVAGFDVDIDPLVRNEVFYIQQADAKELADVLKQLVTGQQQAAKQAQSQAQKNAQSKLATRTNTKTKQTTKVATPASTAAAAAPRAEIIPTLFGEENNSFEFSQFVTIVPDERSNAIAVYGTPSDLRQIKSVIDKMDISRMQVRVEVVITEVTLTEQQVSGLENFALNGVNINQGDWRIDASGKTGSVDNTSDPAFSFTLENYTLQMVFNTAKRDRNVKVLSAPSITTTHNEKGTIEIVEERPRATSSTTNLNAQTSSDTSQVTQEIEWEKIGIILKLNEIRVGPNGTIQMEIEQKSSNVLEYQTVAGIQTPIISTREAQSFVTAKDGEVIVLGGLQSNSETESDGRVTFWGDLPLIGNLFRPRQNETIRRELIIFLRPTVVRSDQISKALTQEQVANSGFAEDLKEFYETGTIQTTRQRAEAKKQSAETPAANKTSSTTPVGIQRTAGPRH